MDDGSIQSKIFVRKFVHRHIKKNQTDHNKTTSLLAMIKNFTVLLQPERFWAYFFLKGFFEDFFYVRLWILNFLTLLVLHLYAARYTSSRWRDLIFFVMVVVRLLIVIVFYFCSFCIRVLCTSACGSRSFREWWWCPTKSWSSCASRPSRLWSRIRPPVLPEVCK